MNQGHEVGDKATDKATDPLFRCSQCSKQYKRPEHLQRHSATHRAARDYRCEWCSATFQRSDVLGRHAKTCDGTRSRRMSVVRRACDACVKDKRKCSLNPPCLHCRKRDISCTFTVANSRDVARGRREWAAREKFTDDLSSAAEPSASIDSPISALGNMDDEAWSLFLNTSLPDIITDDFDWMMLAAGCGAEERSLRFLESFTRNTGFVHSFDCLTLEERTLAYTTFLSRLAISETPDDGLLLKCHEIVRLIRETVEVKPRNNPITLNWSTILEDDCMKFFSPQQIRLWLEMYWAIWHPNVNFMHRPTFNPRSMKPPLVAAMCVIGALVSPNQADQDSARLWMNSVEEMVFRDDDVCYNGERSSSFPTAGRLQALQAMYMVRRPLCYI